MATQISRYVLLGGLAILWGCLRDPGKPMDYRLPNLEPVELWSVKDSLPLKENTQRYNLREGPLKFLGIEGKGAANYIEGKPDRINGFEWTAEYVDTSHFLHGRDTIVQYFRSRYGPEQRRVVDGFGSDSSGYVLDWKLPFDSLRTYDMVLYVSVMPYWLKTRYTKVLVSHR